ncbi:MAG: RICIN domain-containing protein [Ruminococcus sp.]
MKTKFFSLITAFVMILSFSVFVPEINAKATQNRTANFSKDYTLGSDPAQNILNIALAQQGKTGSDLGYSEEWCADFVSDCADLAGQSDAIPRYGAVSGLKTRILNAGGYDVTSSPRAGDIVFFSGHVEIVHSVSGGQIYSIGGNTTSASSLYSRKVCSPRVHGGVVSVIRPNYSGSWYDNYSPVDLGDNFCAFVSNSTTGGYLNNEGWDVRAYSGNGENNQAWIFNKQSDGSYVITSLLDNNRLTIYNHENLNGSSVIVTTDEIDAYQKWYIYNTSDGYIFRPSHSDKVMDVDGGGYTSGTNIQIYEYNSTYSQYFKIEKKSWPDFLVPDNPGYDLL